MKALTELIKLVENGAYTMLDDGRFEYKTENGRYVVSNPVAFREKLNHPIRPVVGSPGSKK